VSKRDYYEVLGVSRTATEVEIKSSYRRLAMKYHPDRNPGDKAAEDQFKLAAEAYAILADSDNRSADDRLGTAGAGQPDGGGRGHGIPPVACDSHPDGVGERAVAGEDARRYVSLPRLPCTRVARPRDRPGAPAADPGPSSPSWRVER